MATLCAEVFLTINGSRLLTNTEELTNKVLETVLSDARAYKIIQRDLADWFVRNTEPAS